MEQSRDEARAADLVVTNHALLAIDAMHGGTALPEHEAVIIDEAHELAARVTGAASAELSPADVDRVGRRALGWLDDDDLASRAAGRRPTRSGTRWRRPRWSGSRTPALPVSRPARPYGRSTRRVVSALGNGDGQERAGQRQAAAAVKEVFDIAERMAALSEHDVVWVADRERSGREARVAPLTVAA